MPRNDESPALTQQFIAFIKRQKTANRSYQFLAIAHFILFGVGVAARGLHNGASLPTAILGGLGVGTAFLLVLLHLADYHGNGPGDGRLVGGGGRGR